MDLNASLKKIESEKPHPIVFISGLGGSGKTTFARKLVAEDSNARMFEFDWYLIHSSKERARRIKEAQDSGDPEQITQEWNPRNWYDWDTFKKDIVEFQEKGDLTLSQVWNQKTGEKDLDVHVYFSGASGAIICEGLYLLHPEVTSLADLVVLIEANKEEARSRAEARDVHRTSSDHLARKVLIMEKYDIPYFKEHRPNADIILSS